jgi:hypothetical protein
MAAGERPLVGDYAPPVGRSPAAILIVVTGQANCRSTELVGLGVAVELTGGGPIAFTACPIWRRSGWRGGTAATP